MKRRFNLIEVTLAIAVIGFGMVGVMSLFPVGLNATRQAVAENYAADAADQFLTYIARECNGDITNAAGTFWTDYITSAAATAIPTACPTEADETAATFSGTAAEGGIYASNNAGLYRIKQASALVTDFEGTVRLWKSEISGIWIYEQGYTITYPYAVRLNMEISWPAAKPYSKRDKRSFCIEIFRQKF